MRKHTYAAHVCVHSATQNVAASPFSSRGCPTPETSGRLKLVVVLYYLVTRIKCTATDGQQVPTWYFESPRSSKNTGIRYPKRLADRG